MTQTVDIEKPREVLRKLAEFRNGLEQREQVLIDALVGSAYGATPDAGANGDLAALPTEAEVETLVGKMTAFENTLPADERQLVDALLAKGTRSDAEVEAHWTLVFDQFGDAGAFPYYYAQCKWDTWGAGSLQALPSPLWYWPSRVEYTCWGW